MDYKTAKQKSEEIGGSLYKIYLAAELTYLLENITDDVLYDDPDFKLIEDDYIAAYNYCVDRYLNFDAEISAYEACRLLLEDFGIYYGAELEEIIAGLEGLRKHSLE